MSALVTLLAALLAALSPRLAARGAFDERDVAQVVEAAVRYRVQAPFVDSLLSDIGIDGANIAKSDIFRNASDMTRAASEAARAKAPKVAADKKEGR